MKKRLGMRAFALALTASFALASGAAHASSDAEHPKHITWPFDGPLGKVDKQSAQRGFQVYKEVCSACHGVGRVAFRSLQDIGFTEAEVKALAASYEYDDIGEDGEPKPRKGLPSDKIKPPFANDKAASAANNGAIPPDLSLMVKARPDGANYLYSLLTGYATPPAGETVAEGMHYNPYFPGHKIAMAPPLSDGQVTYQDGTKATVEQMARDAVNFLQWAAEPKMEQRKSMGLKVMAFLFIMTVLFYLAYKRVWRDAH